MANDDLAKFRDQANALGAFWILVAGLTALSAYMSSQSGAQPVAGSAMAIAILVGAVYFAMGVMICLKKLWAVSAGLVLAYLSLVGNLLTTRNVIAIGALIIVIMQSHRVQSLGKKLTSLDKRGGARTKKSKQTGAQRGMPPRV